MLNCQIYLIMLCYWIVFSNKEFLKRNSGTTENTLFSWNLKLRFAEFWIHLEHTYLESSTKYMFHINNATHLVIKSNYYGLIVHQIFELSHSYDWSKHMTCHITEYSPALQNWRISKWCSPISKTMYDAKNIWAIPWRYSIHLWTFSCSSKPLSPFLELCFWKTDNVHGQISKIIICQIFLLTRDWSKHITWSNIQAKTGEYLKIFPNFQNCEKICPNTLSLP